MSIPVGMNPGLLLALVTLLLAIGAFAGVLAGFLGVGGVVVLVPAFFYAFLALGYGRPEPMRMCLATSLATIIVTSARSVLAHNRKGAVDKTVLKTWAPGIVLGALAGVVLAAALGSAALQVIFGVLAMVVGLYMGVEMGWMPLSPDGIACAKLAVSKHKLKERASMGEATIIGLDLAKNVFQLHGAAAVSLPVAFEPNDRSNHQRINSNNDLGGGECWTAGPSPPPLALAKGVSRSGCGRIFRLS